MSWQDVEKWSVGFVGTLIVLCVVLFVVTIKYWYSEHDAKVEQIEVEGELIGLDEGVGIMTEEGLLYRVEGVEEKPLVKSENGYVFNKIVKDSLIGKDDITYSTEGHEISNGVYVRFGFVGFMILLVGLVVKDIGSEIMYDLKRW